MACRRMKFLAACKNFKSCNENAMLLIFGYIREETRQIPIYEYIPIEIVNLIYTTCYRHKKFREGNTHNYWDARSMRILNDTEESIFDFEHNDTLLSLIDNKKVRRIAVVTRITNERIRKVWKFKVTKTACLDERVPLKMFLSEYNTYTRIMGQPKQFSLIYVEDNSATNEKSVYIKAGDVIQILFINHKKQNKFTRYAINDRVYPLREICKDQMQLNLRRYRLVLCLAHQVTLQMMN